MNLLAHCSVEHSSITILVVVSICVLGGRKIDPRAVKTGLHSHDGGKTWSKH